MAAQLIETHDLLVDEGARAGWASLDQSQQNALLFWVNTPRFSRRRRARQGKAVAALQRGRENWDPIDYRDSAGVVVWRGFLAAGFLVVVAERGWSSSSGVPFRWPLVLALVPATASLVALARVNRGGCDVDGAGLAVRSWFRSRWISYDDLQAIVSTERDRSGKWVEWASVVLIYRDETGREKRFRICSSHSNTRPRHAAARLHGALPASARARIRLVQHPLGYLTLRYLSPG